MTNDIIIQGKFSTESDPAEFIEKLQNLCKDNKVIFTGRFTVTEFTDYEEIIENV